MNRKKILFVARWYPDRHDNMLGLFVQKHAMAVQAHYDVIVLYVTADTTMAPGLSAFNEQVFEGIHEYHIYFGKHNNEIKNALAFCKYYLKGIKRIRKKFGNPALTHVHILSRTAFPALWLKYKHGIPYIITEHWSRYLPINTDKGAYSGFLRKWFTKLAVSRAAAVTTVTENLASAMQNLGLKNRYFITPNVADTNLFVPVLIKSDNGIKKFIHVSCFDEPAKNIKGIVDAVQNLAKQRNDFILEIIGDGKDFKMVKNYAEQSGLLNKRIFFTGLLTGTTLTEKMQEATALVMFSNYENLPCTIVESMCCGVPVISTDVGGIKEHLTPDFGILIKPGDKKALEIAIHQVIIHPEQYKKADIRAYAVKTFSMEAVGTHFAHIYEEATRKQ